MSDATREIEIKLRVESHAQIRQRLQELGAVFVRRALETNYIYDSGDGRLRRTGKGLRVRALEVEEGTPAAATLTFKGPRTPGPVKAREELETEVANADMAARILDRLGFVQILRYQKQRESWRLGACNVELDTAPPLGFFVEIEGPDEAQIRAVQAELNLDQIEPEPHTYVALFLAQKAPPQPG